MKTARTLSVLLFAGILSACAPTETSRSTGQVIDDAALTTRVKTQIAQKEGVAPAAAVNVDSFRGAVSLSGFVESAARKRQLGQIAQNVPGVEKVFNNLVVQPEASGQ